VPIDRVTTLTYVAFSAASTKRNSAVYLRQVMQAFASKIYTALTDNGEAFTEQPGAVTARPIGLVDPTLIACATSVPLNID